MAFERLKIIDTEGELASELISWIRHSLVPALPHADIYIFGSFAKNRFSEASDLDIAIVYEDGLFSKEIFKIANQALKPRKWPLDILVLSRSYFEARRDFGGICMEIAQDHHLLYRGLKEEKNDQAQKV